MKARFAAAIVTAALLFGGAAHANGRLPASNAFVFDPSDANKIYLRTTFGLLVADDDGHNWDWICERSLGFNGPEDPSFGAFSNGTLVGTLFEGLVVTKDKACTFNLVGGPLMGQVFIDIAVRKTDPTSAVVISSSYANATDEAGDALFNSFVYVTTDNGNTWTQKGLPLDESLLVETIDWSPVDANRMYISAARQSGDTNFGVLLESDDGGGTWTEHALPLVGDERAPYIGALDPVDADTIYVRTTSPLTDAGTTGASRLLVSKNKGVDWSSPFATTSLMQGLAISDDGAKIYVGSQTDGLYIATTAALAFTKQNAIQVQCLAYNAGNLWACSNEFSGFVAGVSIDDGVTFDTRLHLDTVRGPLACPSTTPTYQLCTADWPAQADQLGITLDGGSSASDGSTPLNSDGGSSLPPVNGGSSSGGCSCDLIGAPSAASTGLTAALAALFVLRQGRKRGERNERKARIKRKK